MSTTTTLIRFSPIPNMKLPTLKNTVTLINRLLVHTHVNHHHTDTVLTDTKHEITNSEKHSYAH